MTVPEIPDEVWDAVAGHVWPARPDLAPERYPEFMAVVMVVWPLLYAAALRDAATSLDGSLGVEGKPQDLYEFRVYLRHLADEAVSA